uniref:Mitogen-activated protein kinase n=1 Tax=Pfiesteria piscicida TaxID=71001 RepID=Q9LD35_PFIPI|nr:mitogen-activated protein kinase [Pfiesteria piscicida]
MKWGDVGGSGSKDVPIAKDAARGAEIGGRGAAVAPSIGQSESSGSFQKLCGEVLLDLPKHLVAVKQVGKGAYGEVFLCKDERTQGQVAVKVIRDFTKDLLFGKRIFREVKILMALQHENLMRLIDLPAVPSPDFNVVYMVMPYMLADLHRMIYSSLKLVESHCQAFTCQILRGLKYLHSAGIVHRDLKPANIMVNKNCTLRITDFGLARGRCDDEEVLTDYVVTRWYRAPELMLVPSSYFEAIDLWSVGCIHFECVARTVLFPGEHHFDMLKKIADTLGMFTPEGVAWCPQDQKGEVDTMLNKLEDLRSKELNSLASRLPEASEVCLDLLLKLLDKVPSTRISAAEALEHPYLQHLRDPAGETVAKRPFAWDFDVFEPSERALKDRIYAECARIHPEIITRDAKYLMDRGFKVPAQRPSPADEKPDGS